MMFNYDAESNAASILRAMYREVVPAPRGSVAEDVRRMVAGSVAVGGGISISNLHLVCCNPGPQVRCPSDHA